MATHYGITTQDIKHARKAMRLMGPYSTPSQSWHYVMAQLAQTYSVRKVMYDTPDSRPSGLRTDSDSIH